MPSLYTYTAMRVDMNVRVYKGAPRMRICLQGYRCICIGIEGVPMYTLSINVIPGLDSTLFNII